MVDCYTLRVCKKEIVQTKGGAIEWQNVISVEKQPLLV